MQNTLIPPLGPKVDNLAGPTGQEDCSEYNDNISELYQPIIDAGSVMTIAKTPFQLSMALTAKSLKASSFIEESTTATANLSNLESMDNSSMLVFSAPFVTGNVITINIGYNLTPVNFSVNNATTYAAIQTLIQAAVGATPVIVNATYGIVMIATTLSGVNGYVLKATVTGGASQPNIQPTYGNAMPNNYAQMDGAIVIFNKSIPNTSTPQINIATGTLNGNVLINIVNGTMLGVLNVVLPGGGTIPAGGMGGICICRLNLSLNSGTGAWELLYSSNNIAGSVYNTSTNYSSTNTDGYNTIQITTSSSQLNYTLPKASSNTGRTITIKKMDSGTGSISIYPYTGDSINANIGISPILNIPIQYNSIAFQSNGLSWDEISRHMKYEHNGAGEYNLGMTYNSVPLTLTYTNQSTYGGTAIPYRTWDGTWHLYINGYANLSTSLAYGVALPITVSGAFNFSSNQGIGGSAATEGYVMLFVTTASPSFNIASGSSQSTFYFTFDFIISAKPTWLA